MPNPMYTSASAMKAYSTALSMYADNSANTQSTSGKRMVPTFTSVITGDSSGKSLGGGVNVEGRRMISEVGVLQPTDGNTDCGIAGSGFFIVKRNITDSDVYYTRKGDFTQNEKGYLVNAAGYYLMGWETDGSGMPLAANSTNLSSVKPLNVNTLTGISRPTSVASVKLNLNASADQDTKHSTPLTVYDSLGVGHDLMLTWTRQDPASGLKWKLDITAADGSPVKKESNDGADYSGLIVEFNTDGTVKKWDAGIDEGAPLPDMFITWANGAGTTATPIKLNFGTSGALNTAKADGVTCLGGPNNNSYMTQNGIKYGNFNGISIGEDGIVTARFDNGETISMYKIPLANFASVNELGAVSGNAYVGTRKSGTSVLNQANVNGMGKIVSGSLEASNCDLANEFVGTMITNRSFGANAKMITVADNMLEKIENLLR